MKARLLFIGALMCTFCYCAGHARAAIWCGHGQGSVLDHPCGASDVPKNSSVTAVIDKFYKQSERMKGVWSVDSATSAAQGGAEIQVRADPPWAACAKSQLPSSFEGIPVIVIPIAIPKDVQFSSAGTAVRYGPAPEILNQGSDNAKTYTRIVRNHGQKWMSLPGVIGIAPGECDCGSCDFTEIEISVQRPFMSALAKQIPPTIDDVPITLLPSD
ncbi:MAG: hypothetical protein ACREQR_00445 [Candidatus Binataceae bacterium]